MIHEPSVVAQVDPSAGACRAAPDGGGGGGGSRAPGGLGRGLAGILDDMVAPPGPNHRRGLDQLLGRGLGASLPRVRQFVTDTALAAIADGFGAEAVVIARRDGIGLPAVVSSRIPPSWEEVPGLTFELFGQLWRLLDEASSAGPGRPSGGSGDSPTPFACPSAGTQVVRVGSCEVWLGRQETVEGHLVAAVARNEPFGSSENETLGRLIRSLAVAMSAEGEVLPPGAVISLTVGQRAVNVHEADLTLALDGRPRRATAGGSTPELAVARAAAAACGVRCEVTFAGRTRLDGADVTLVLVNDGAGSPLLGIAVSDPGDEAGGVEAVVSAISLLGQTRRG